MHVILTGFALMKNNFFSKNLSGKGMKFALIVSRFNEQVTKGLERGARRALEEAGVAEEDIVVYYVPGAFEIPFTAATVVEKRAVDAVICLGAIIRGETPHFEYISRAVSSGIMELNLRAHKPVVFGVLTTDTLEQADARSGQGSDNKGYEAGMAAVEMVTLMKNLNSKLF